MSVTNLKTSDADSFADIFYGSSEMAQLMRSYDWLSTPLGNPRSWPQSLKSALSICLNSRYPIAIYWGKELALLYNDDWSPIPGKKHPWALGKKGHEVWPEIWETIGPMFEKVLESGEGTWAQDQLLLMHRHGYTEECYFNFTFSPILGEGGKIEGIFNAVVETTDRVIGERRLRTLRDLGAQAANVQSTERAAIKSALETLSANTWDAPFAAVFLAEDSLEAPQLAAAQTGKQHIPETLSAASHASNWPIHEVLNKRIIQIVDFPSSELKQINTAWEDAHVESAAIIPLSSQNETIRGVLVIGLNPRKKWNTDYQDFASLAANHVATSISNARAYEYERKRSEELAKIDKAKTAFFSNVSHEFRTPLTLMLGPIEDVLANPDTLPANRKHMEIAHRNAIRLLKLVNTLLEFSRMEAGRTQASFRKVDISSYTSELASNFRSAMEKAELDYDVTCEPVSGPVYVDTDMWEKIVLNLLSNAFKFTLSGGVELHLGKVGDEVILSVKDTGTGIPESELPHLFERFRRVEGAKGRTHEGSGIGLALVNELVKLHGGRIEVESKENEGSIFQVIVPLGKDHLPAEAIQNSETTSSTDSSAGAYVKEALRWLPHEHQLPDTISPLNDSAALLNIPEPTAGARIVLADDNADMREYVSRLLSSQYHVEAVSDGAAALALIERQTPDLVITDIMMPTLDGFELIKAIRSNVKFKDLPVVILSARAGAEARMEGIEAGADDYLLKPFFARELMARINGVIRLSQMRKESETILRESDLRLRTALQAGRMGTWELNVEKQQLTCSDICKTNYGLTPEESLTYQSVESRVHKDDLVYWNNTICEAIKNASDFEMEYRIVWNDQSIHWIYVRGSCTASKNGEAVMLSGVSVEITERKQTEQIILEAKLQADAANLAKSEFLANMSHEIRTPMNAVVGLSHILGKSEGLSAKQKNYIHTLQLSADSLLNLINDLLDISKIESRSIELEHIPFSITVLLDEIVSMMSLRAKEKNLEFKATTDCSESLKLIGDPTRLRQIVVNLCSNAIKFTDKGSVVINLTCSSGDRENVVNAIINVKDSGIGIAEKNQELIFQKFTQADASINRKYGGTGLGLAITKTLVEIMGGTISLQSKLGEGSTFTVMIPLMTSEPEWKSSAAKVTHNPESDTHSGHRVLLVEDYAANVLVAGSYLEQFGYQYDVVDNGYEAIEKARSGKYLAILMDVQMHGINGLEATKLIRQNERTDGKTPVPIIGMTAHALRGDEEKCLAAGMDAYLSKPYNPDELSKKLSAYVARL